MRARLTSRSTTGWPPPRSWSPSAQRFDLVCAMEVVEHVADPAGFLAACAALVRPGGGLVLATLNRTFRAFALGIVAAEYVLGWLPRGTHRWSRFVRPSEAARPLRRAGLRIEDLTGVVYDPLRDRFRLSRDHRGQLHAVRDPGLSVSAGGPTHPDRVFGPGCLSDGETIDAAIADGADALWSWIRTARNTAIRARAFRPVRQGLQRRPNLAPGALMSLSMLSAGLATKPRTGP